jgi:hypothetical protein
MLAQGVLQLCRVANRSWEGKRRKSLTGCKYSLLIAPANKEYGKPILAGNNIVMEKKKDGTMILSFRVAAEREEQEVLVGQEESHSQSSKQQAKSQGTHPLLLQEE